MSGAIDFIGVHHFPKRFDGLWSIVVYLHRNVCGRAQHEVAVFFSFLYCRMQSDELHVKCSMLACG